MAKPTDKELQEFWERRGLKYEIDEDEFKVILPDGDWYNFGHHADIDPTFRDIEPELDLNNLFKYAVPSKEVPSFHLSYEYYLSGYIYRARVCNRSGIWREGQHETDPAIALYQAIQPVRGREE